MKVTLIDYTPNAMHKIAEMARATRKNELDVREFENDLSIKIKETFNSDDKYVKALIGYGHLGILEHINFTFHVSEISLVTTHQLVRHRLASYLQRSGRHAKPNVDEWVTPQTIYKDSYTRTLYLLELQRCYNTYTELIENGVPIEDARYILPPAFYTHISFTMNCRTLIHFLELRLDKSSQWEIRKMATEIFKIVYNIYPIIFESLKDKFDKDDPIRLAIEHHKTMNGLAEK